MSIISKSLRVVDRLEVWIVVDTTLDILSTVPNSVTSELANLLAAGMKQLSPACLCCAAWGLSLVIRIYLGETQHTLLFDAGPEAYTFERNIHRLGINLSTIETVVLSHGHFDHAGGLLQALRMIQDVNGGQPLSVHVNPDMFVSRAYKLADGRILPLADIPTPEELAAAGGQVVNAREARTILEDTVFISGEIPRVTSYEKGLPQQLCRANDGNWIPDPLVLDERFVAINVRDLGLVVFSS